MEQYIGKIIMFAVIVFITWIAVMVVSHLMKRVMHKRDGSPLPSGSIYLNITRAALWLIGASIALNSCFGIDMSAIIATLGVGGIAVSLGFQDTLSNLIGGLQVSMGGIVQPNDWIEVLDQRGKVKDITWRHTSIIDIDGIEHLIPNSLINKNSLIHLGTEGEVTTNITIPLGTDLEDFRKRVCDSCDSALEGLLAPGKKTLLTYSGSTDYGIAGVIRTTVLRDKITPARARDKVTMAIDSALKEAGSVC